MLPHAVEASKVKNGPARTPPSYQVDSKKKLVSVKFLRKVTASDIENYARALRMDPRFHPDFSEIADLREVEELDLSPDEFIRLADSIDPFSLEAKRAFVVGNEVQHHAARMHKILRAQRNFEIFRSMETAQQWLQV
jgi:hypothetical protein